MKRLIGTTFMALVLGGCSIGQSDFSCSLGSEASICASSRTIYKATNGELDENETITYVEDGEKKQITVAELAALQSGDAIAGKSPTSTSVQKEQQADNTSLPYSFNYDGKALRTDAKVMRIWIAPWNDQMDTLHMSTVLFTDMEKRKWLIVDSRAQTFGVEAGAKIKRSARSSEIKSTDTKAKDVNAPRRFVPPPEEIEKIQKRFSQQPITNNGE